MQYGYKKNEKDRQKTFRAVPRRAARRQRADGCGGGTAADENNPGGDDGVFTIAYAPNRSNTGPPTRASGSGGGAAGGSRRCEWRNSGQRLQCDHRGAAHGQCRYMAYMEPQALALNGSAPIWAHRHEEGRGGRRKNDLPFGAHRQSGQRRDQFYRGHSGQNDGLCRPGFHLGNLKLLPTAESFRHSRMKT